MRVASALSTAHSDKPPFRQILPRPSPRDKAKEQREHKPALIAEMSLRMDALGRKENGNNEPEIDTHRSTQDLVAHINRLQQELYEERRKNQRLQGA